MVMSCDMEFDFSLTHFTLYRTRAMKLKFTFKKCQLCFDDKCENILFTFILKSTKTTHHELNVTFLD